MTSSELGWAADLGALTTLGALAAHPHRTLAANLKAGNSTTRPAGTSNHAFLISLISLAASLPLLFYGYAHGTDYARSA